MSLFVRIIERLGGGTAAAGGPVRAVWNGVVLAESDETIVVEGNHYFPPSSLNREHFVASNRQTSCPWKGQASYYSVEVGGKRNDAAAWTYRKPKPAAAQIRDYVAFWHGVKVVSAD